MVFQGIVDSAELVATDDEHDPEGHTIAYERQQVAALIRDARTRLGELEQALVRVDAGSYGVCTSCGAKIPAERLNARPGAHTRSEEHTSELQSLMRTAYASFCFKK